MSNRIFCSDIKMSMSTWVGMIVLLAFAMKNKISYIAVLNGRVHNFQKYSTISNPQTACGGKTKYLNIVYTSSFGDLSYTRQKLEHTPSVPKRMTF
jgi:hypothetical protein